MHSRLLLILLSFTFLTASSQQQFPYSISADVDADLERIYELRSKGDTAPALKVLTEVDKKLGSLNNEFPLYRGVIRLFQSYYAFDNKVQEAYRKEGLSLLKGSDSTLVDSFAIAFYNVMQLHYKSKRMKEWWSIDSAFRSSLTKSPSKAANNYAILNYAHSKLGQKQYFLSKQLALYDYYIRLYQNSKEPWEKLSLVHADWIITKSDLDQWLSMPYQIKFPEEYKKQTGPETPGFVTNNDEYTYLRSQNFNNIYKTLFSRLKELRKELIIDNAYSKKEFDLSIRRGYYNIYFLLLNDFYNWSVSEHKEGLALLPFREFLYLDLIPNELEAAEKAAIKPVVGVTDFVKTIQNLATLYHHLGNGIEAKETVMNGLGWIINEKTFSQSDGYYGLIKLLKTRIQADRLQRNFESAFKGIQSLKKFTRLPEGASPQHMEQWEEFMQTRIEEAYTHLAAGMQEAARDSFANFLDQLSPLDDKSETAKIYSTKAWPQLQYLVSILQAQRNKWMIDLLRESIADMENETNRHEIYYPVQLFYLKAMWRTEKKLSESLLSNLLFYTGRQLRFTFIMLSAEDRMRLFEQQLSPFFDVYHELLFSGHLDSYPIIKEKIIAQSLSLKNALADGNLIPNEIFQNKPTYFSLADVEELRELRQQSNLIQLRTKLKRQETKESRALQDRTQYMWLDLLEKSGMDTLTQFTKWQKIQGKLKEGEVYTETIRYNRWLTDSSVHYGAYVITSKERIKPIYLYPEKKLTEILKNPSASPQNGSLNSDGTRGVIVLQKGNEKSRPYKKGDPDQLAALLLKPLWPYLQGKRSWYYVQDGLLNRISFAALQKDGNDLFNYIELNQLSGSYSLMQGTAPKPTKTTALLAGGLDYGTVSKANNRNRLFKTNYNWSYLPGTQKEIQKLQTQFNAAGVSTTIFSKDAFQDTLLNRLSPYHIIHLATHGFYLDSIAAQNLYTERWNKEAIKYEPLYRSGIAVSNANAPDSSASNADGYLLGYELANIDLRKCYLITLSACETGLGDLRNNLGVDGLSRALKISGAKHLLISLWKVPDEPTSVFMEQFYKNLFSGKTPVQALRLTQTFMSKKYEVQDWAAFVLVQ